MKNKKLLLLLIISILILSSCKKVEVNDNKENTLPVDNIIADQNDTNNNDNGDSTNNQENETIKNDIDEEKEARTINTIVVLETAKTFMDSEYIVQTYLDKAAANELKFFSAANAIKTYETNTIDNIEGVLLIDLIDKEKLIDAQSYIITSYDNCSIGVSKNDMENGILYIDDNGNYAVKFSGLSDRTNIKKVISIAIDQNN